MTSLPGGSISRSAFRRRKESTALLVDFGSTFTKATAVDLEEGRILGRAQAQSTVSTDVREGLLAALRLLNDRCAIFEGDEPTLDALDSVQVLACSSAAGGLRMVVVGNVPGLTLEAGNVAALGAGAKVVGGFGFRLSEDDLLRIVALAPDIVLLTGGVDGGDAKTIMHNAGMLSRAPLSCSFVVAGNARAAAQVAAVLEAAGKEVGVAGNVMPRAGVCEAGPAGERIRGIFAQKIIEAKGLDKVQARVPIVLPTPVCVQEGALLGSQGLPGDPGCGDVLVVDVGGATTDVHSIGDGASHRPGLVVPRGLPEPFAKRTVEGDLGIRWNAATILAQVGKEAFCRAFGENFPEAAIEDSQLVEHVRMLSDRTGFVPSEPWHAAVDAVLTQFAVELAIDRHVGRAETYFAENGAVLLQSGKDLTDVPLVIATGGVFGFNPHSDRMLRLREESEARVKALRPARPLYLTDRHYILFAVGLLARSRPEVALQIFRRHFGRAAGDDLFRRPRGSIQDACC